MIETKEVTIQTEDSTKQWKPTIIEPHYYIDGIKQPVKMIRNHSFMATVQEIIAHSEEVDAFRISILGNTHSGKSTLSLAIAHAIHKLSKIKYGVKVLGKSELINLVKTLSTLEPINWILIFDDVSWLKAHATDKEMNILSSALSTIRHLPGGQNVKIISILNFHYSKALPPYVRDSEFQYTTTVGQVEIANMLTRYGEHNMPKVYFFKKLQSNAVKTKKMTFHLSGENFFSYKYKKPFIPVLFSTQDPDSLRIIVTPSKESIDPICSICDNANPEFNKETVSTDEFIQNFEDKHGRDVSHAVIKHRLLMNGLNTYHPRFKRAFIDLDRQLLTQSVSFEELATKYQNHMKQRFLEAHNRIEPEPQREA